MAAKRFSTTYISDRNVSRTIEIWDTDFAGASTDFETAAGGYSITYSDTGDQWPGIFKATQCQFTLLVQNSTHEALVTDFSTSPEGRFMVKITDGSTLVWTGNILTDSTSYDEAYYPFSLKITAVDGIGTLKDIDFANAGSPYTGKNLVIEYITRCLSKISYVSTFYSVGDRFVRTAVDWWEETMTNSSSGADCFNFTYLDNSVYYKFDKGVQKYQSCYDVLKDILTTFECTITYANGAFWINQTSYREASTIVTRSYGTDAAFISANNYTDTNPITQVQSGALIATGEYDFTAGILEARHEFAAWERRNFMQAKNHYIETDSVKTYNTPIHGNSNTTTLRLSGGISIKISSDSPVPGYTSPFMPFAAVFRINFALDTKGLERLYTLSASYQVQYAPIQWSATPAFYVIIPFSGPFMANVNSDIFTFAQTLDVITPFLPENCDDFSFSFQLESLQRYDGGTYNLADFTITYDFENVWLEAYSYGSPVLSDDGHEYVTQSGQPTNTEVAKSESLIGSSFNPNTLGALWVKPASTYILAAAWHEGVSITEYDYIGQLLTTTIAGMRAVPTRRLTGRLMGDIVSVSLVTWLGEKWLLVGGTWESDNDIFSGTWILMKHTAGLSPSAPIKLTPFLTGINPPIYGGTPGLVGVNTGTATTGQSEFNSAAIPPGTLLYPVAQTLTNEDLRAGSITTFDIADTLADNDFNVGDLIAIVNPFTGAFQQLTINAATTAGQTTLTVSAATLLLDYPVGSPVVKIPKIGSGASMPGGTNGQIFKRISGKWKGYSGATIGHVLTWDGSAWVSSAPSGGTGTVTSFSAGDLSPLFTTSEATVTTTPALSFAQVNQNANLIFAGPATGAAAAPTFRALALADIANSLITYAKIQNISADKRILGNVSGAAGAIAELTAAQVYTMLSLLSIAADQIVYGTGANGMASNAALKWLTATLQLQVAGNGGSDFWFLGSSGAAISGSIPLMGISRSASGDMYISLENTRNISNSGTTTLYLTTGGTSGSDPRILFRILGAGTSGVDLDVSFGVDNSAAGDPIRLTPRSSNVGGTANVGMTWTQDAATLVGINKDLPAHPLHVEGRAMSTLFIGKGSSWTSANIAFGTGAGTGPAVNTIHGHGNGVMILFTTGTAPVANGTIFTATFPTTFPAGVSAIVTFSAFQTDASATEFLKFKVSAQALNNFIFKAVGTLTASTAYGFNFHISGYDN
jgi:hypothetical protein